MYHLQRNEMYRLGDNAQKSYVVHRRLTSESDDILIQRGIADKKCPEFHAVLYKFVMKSGENSSRHLIIT